MHLCLNPYPPFFNKGEAKEENQKAPRLASLANVFKNLHFLLRADYFHFSLEICISSSGVTPSA